MLPSLHLKYYHLLIDYHELCHPFPPPRMKVSASVSVSHQLLMAPCPNLFWVACFLFLGSLSFDFCYDLDIWAQGQAVRALFVLNCFSTILSKVWGDFDQTWQEAS